MGTRIITAILKESDLRKRIAVPVFLIAIAMVAAVVWSLHINGITMTSADPVCGMEEHIHSESCYAWVEAGTEEIDGTEGLEAVEETEGADEEEKLDNTEDSIYIEKSETETTSSESEAKTEDGSADEEKVDAESITEASTEEVTEEATEEITEEETELPQPGDTKIIDGVEYVYALVCGLEEHTHTDECYIDSTEGSELAEVTAGDDEEFTNTAGVAAAVANAIDLTAGNDEDDDAGTEDGESGIAAISEDGDESGIATASDDADESGIATASEDGDSSSSTASSGIDLSEYYLASTVDYADGLTSGENYIVYTIIDDSYYVLTSDGNLVKCAVISSIDDATGDGPYYISSTGSIVYAASASNYADATWTATAEDASAGSYKIYNEKSRKYLSPDSILAIATSFSAHTGELTLTGDFTLTYTFTNTSNGSNNWDNYILEMVSDGVYIDVRSDNFGWLTGAVDSDILTFGDGLSDWTTWYSAMSAGAEVTVKVVKSGSYIDVTLTAAGETFTASAYVSSYTSSSSVTIYLTGENCTIADVSYEYTIGSTMTSGSASSVLFTSDEKAATLAVAGSNGGATISYSSYYLTLVDASSSKEMTWETGSSQVFYFAETQGTADSYHFADSVTLADAAESQDETYVVYTEINGNYYIVSAVDGSLMKCTDISSSSYSEDEKVLLSASRGVYIWEFDSSGEPVFKFTTGDDSSGEDEFEDYRWMVSSSDYDSSSGAGTYTLENEKNSGYLAPQVDVTTDTLVSGSSGNATSSTVEISTYGTIAYNMTVEDVGSSGSAYLQYTVYQKGYASRRIQIRCQNSGISLAESSSVYTSYDISGSLSLSKGDSLTVTITTYDGGVSFNFYNETTGKTCVCTVVTSYSFSGGACAYTWASSGSFTVYAVTGEQEISYKRLSRFSESIMITYTDKYRWSVTATGYRSENFTLLAQIATDSSGTAEIEWVDTANTSAGDTATGTATTTLSGETVSTLAAESKNLTLTFSLARVREYVAWFDETNGGVTVYNKLPDTPVKSYCDAYGNSYVTALTVDDSVDASYFTLNLRGWYDIYSQAYYEQGETFALSNHTVLYADWMLASYDNGSSSDSGLASSVSTSSFITTTLYDFNELFNLYSANMLQVGDYVTVVSGSDDTDTEDLYQNLSAGTHQEIFTNRDTSRSFMNSSFSLDFMFFRTELHYMTTGTAHNPIIDDAYSRSSQNSSKNVVTQGILGSLGTTTTASSTYGTTDKSTNNLLTVLFGTGNTVDDYTDKNNSSIVYGKNIVGTGDYLFQYNETTGYYYYDSSRNGASYNQTDGRFYVYSDTDKIGSTTYFLPFNAAGTLTNTNYPDYWFGMSTEIQFYLADDVPKSSSDSTYGTANPSLDSDEDNTYHTTFKFSGDDDVWVFIDGVLVLDLGGVHGKVYGEIDFSTGEVRIVNNGSNTTVTERGVLDYTSESDVSYTYNLSNYINLSAGTHTLMFYYLERGAGESNAAIYFNISSTTYNLNLKKVDEDGTTALDGAEYTFYLDSEFTEPALLATEQGDEDTTSTFKSTQTVYGLREGKTYYVKETAEPEGYSSEGKYLTVLLKGSVLTITVYDSTNTAQEQYVYTINYNSSTTECTYTCEDKSESTGTDKVTNNSPWNYVLKGTASFGATVSGGAIAYYSIGIKIANTKEYELPSTGSMGIFPYRRVGTVLVLTALAGLIIMAVYELRRVRGISLAVNKKSSIVDGRKHEKHYARTRDHPRERSVIHGRDAPVVYSGKEKRSRGTVPDRGTGPGPEG